MPQNFLNMLLFIINLLSKKRMTKLMKSIKISFPNFIRSDLACPRKIEESGKATKLTQCNSDFIK